MSTVWRFLVKFASMLVCPLHCFDRVIFKGHLAMAAPAELERFGELEHLMQLVKARAHRYLERPV